MILLVIKFDSFFIIGLIMIKVMNFVKMIDSSGVKVKLIVDGNFLWNYFLKIDRI